MKFAKPKPRAARKGQREILVILQKRRFASADFGGQIARGTARNARGLGKS
jgi:hypothetical protein